MKFFLFLQNEIYISIITYYTYYRVIFQDLINHIEILMYTFVDSKYINQFHTKKTSKLHSMLSKKFVKSQD